MGVWRRLKGRWKGREGASKWAGWRHCTSAYIGRQNPMRDDFFFFPTTSNRFGLSLSARFLLFFSLSLWTLTLDWQLSEVDVLAYPKDGWTGNDGRGEESGRRQGRCTQGERDEKGFAKQEIHFPQLVLGSEAVV